MPTVNQSNNLSNNNKACNLLLSFKDCTLVFKRSYAMSCSLQKSGCHTGIDSICNFIDSNMLNEYPVQVYIILIAFLT